MITSPGFHGSDSATAVGSSSAIAFAAVQIAMSSAEPVVELDPPVLPSLVPLVPLVPLSLPVLVAAVVVPPLVVAPDVVVPPLVPVLVSVS